MLNVPAQTQEFEYAADAVAFALPPHGCILSGSSFMPSRPGGDFPFALSTRAAASTRGPVVWQYLGRVAPD